jgi:plastocyanin
MKRFSTSIKFFPGLCCMLALVAFVPIKAVQAEVWHAIVGAQSTNLGKQAFAFLSNELWIHVGDSITWTFATDEIHTVTFLTANQVRPMAAAVGCPGTTPSGSSFTGASCVNSGILAAGAPVYTVTFPTAGNFKLTCLVHVRMTGAVHVLPLTEILPHDQAFYDRQANKERAELLADASALEGRGNATAQQTSKNEVTAGDAAILGNGGGSHTAAVFRFLGETIVIRTGETVEWTNLGPIVPHTVTFGSEPANLVPPSPGVPTDSDGVLHAVLGSPNASVNSGFLVSPGQEVNGAQQLPLGFTRFRVTFMAPGTYNYICGLHDELGMVGRVIVK